MLAQNPRNLDLVVTWHFADVVEGGWVDRSDITMGPSPEQRFLLVTEGSSDSAVVRKALSLRRDDISDFFTFVDMERGYPFTGSGNVYRFCQGLVSIGISNQVVVLLDNDAAGIEALHKIRRLGLPRNMRALALPDLPVFERVLTDGPAGSGTENINGRAASLE